MQVQVGDVEREEQLGAHLQDCTGEPAGEGGQGAQGKEEHDAPHVAAGAGSMGDAVIGKDTVASKVRTRRTSRDIMDEETGERSAPD